MSLRLFVFLLTLVEVVTVVACIRLLGFGSTVLLCLLSFVLGSALLRWQGLATAEKFIGQLEAGNAPMDAAWDGVCILIAAGLFMIPGLATDLLALLLLIPFVRRVLHQVVMTSGVVKGHYWFDQNSLRVVPGPGVIEASYTEVRTPE